MLATHVGCLSLETLNDPDVNLKGFPLRQSKMKIWSDRSLHTVYILLYYTAFWMPHCRSSVVQCEWRSQLNPDGKQTCKIFSHASSASLEMVWDTHRSWLKYLNNYWIAIKSQTQIRGCQIINCSDFADLLSLHSAASAGQRFRLVSKLSQMTKTFVASRWCNWWWSKLFLNNQNWVQIIIWFGSVLFWSENVSTLICLTNTVNIVTVTPALY